MKVVKYKDKASVIKYWKYLKDWGIEKLADDDWRDRIRISIKSYLQMNIQANKLWEKRGVKFEE